METHNNSTASAAFIPSFEPDAPSLLDQLESYVAAGDMQRGAKPAGAALRALLDESPGALSKGVKQFIGISAQPLAADADTNSLAAAIAAAAIVTAGAAGAQTDHDKLEDAILMLSERYQADW